MPTGILKSVRTKVVGSPSDKSEVSVLLPGAGACLLPAKHAWELNQKMQAIWTPSPER